LSSQPQPEATNPILSKKHELPIPTFYSSETSDLKDQPDSQPPIGSFGLKTVPKK
jgi:hypothetical protein